MPSQSRFLTAWLFPLATARLPKEGGNELREREREGKGECDFYSDCIFLSTSSAVFLCRRSLEHYCGVRDGAGGNTAVTVVIMENYQMLEKGEREDVKKLKSKSVELVQHCWQPLLIESAEK